MLADRIVGAASGDIIGHIETAPKFRITDPVRLAAQEVVLGNRLDAFSITLPEMPAEFHGWLEYSANGVNFGLYIKNNSGLMLVEQTVHGLSAVRVCVEDGLLLTNSPLNLETAWATQVVDFELRITQVIISMIHNPRLVERRPVVIDEALQRRRDKAGKRRLCDHHEVVIHVTRQEREARQAAENHEKRTGKRLHYVRMFHRLKMGKIERVREHWRGDASRGMSRRSNYKVVL